MSAVPLIVGEAELRLITVDEFYRAAELGLYGPEEKLELIDGIVVSRVSPQRWQHAAVIRELEALLLISMPRDSTVISQQPVSVNNLTEPEPDLAIYRGSRQTFWKRHPKIEEALLVVEVSDTTIKVDRGRKRTLYAESMVPEYWVVSIEGMVVEVYRQPLEGDYTETEIFNPGQGLLVPFGGGIVEVDDIFAPLVEE